MKQFLIYCRYDYYCQGTEEAWGYFLVEARTFEEACQKLTKKAAEHDFSNPREFRDCTIS